MQKQTMFESFLKKKQLIAQMLTETKAMTNRDHFHHFQAVSEPVYIKAESNAIYLTHLNNQFKDHLREFVHEQESFTRTIFQLAKITQSLQTEKSQVQNQYKNMRNILNEAQLDKAILTDKNNFHLDKILSLQQQAKTLQLLSQQHQKTATELQQQIEYQKCMLSQIQSRNNQIVSNLQVKTVQIQQATTKMENTQRTIRHKQSSIKKLNKDINQIYYTLEAQDDSLSQLCTAIEEGLNTQNNRINDIQFVKNKLAHVAQQSHLRKKKLAKAQQTHDMLMNYEDDLSFDLRRITKQLQIQEKGIDQQHWKIQQQKQSLQENHLMLLGLQNYLQDLIHKNDLLKQSLQEQIIQDHTIKRIVDSKTQQPVGRKVKLFLQDYQQKELAETSSSWKENNNIKPQNIFLRNTGSILSPKQRRQLVLRQVNKIARKHPQQLEFVFEKYSKLPQQYEIEEQLINENQYQTQEFANKWQPNLLMNTTGFTYIDKLAKFQTEV